jgi:hypothetical protein
LIKSQARRAEKDSELRTLQKAVPKPAQKQSSALEAEVAGNAKP